LLKINKQQNGVRDVTHGMHDVMRDVTDDAKLLVGILEGSMRVDVECWDVCK